MKSAIIYVRVSTADQVENFSMLTQERACRDFCEKQGLNVDQVFREQGESAKTANRTELKRLLNYCARHAKQRGIEAVVIYRIDRLARSVQDHVAIRASLKKLGIAVRAVAEVFDDTPAGRLIEHVMAAVAQFDNDARSVRTVDGMREAMMRGRWVWRPPIGYQRPSMTDGASMILDADRAPLIRRAFDGIATRRLSQAEALIEVTRLGLRTRTGATVSKQSFGYLLRNPVYGGRLVKPEWGVDCEGDFEPLVPMHTFELVASVLEGRAPSSTGRRRDHPDFPLRRIVKCGHCGTSITGSWSSGRTQRYPYYRCPNSDCKASSIRKELMEDRFVELLADTSLRPEVASLLKHVVTRVWEDRVSAATAGQKLAEKRLVELDGMRNKLFDAFLTSASIDSQTFDRQKARLDKEEHRLREVILENTPTLPDLSRVLTFAERLLRDLASHWNRLDASRRAQFAAAVFPGGLSLIDGTIETVETPWWMGISGARCSDTSSLVGPTGFEPVTKRL